MKNDTFLVSPELLQGFASGIACAAFFLNITLLATEMKAEEVSVRAAS